MFMHQVCSKIIYVYINLQYDSPYIHKFISTITKQFSQIIKSMHNFSFTTNNIKGQKQLTLGQNALQLNFNISLITPSFFPQPQPQQTPQQKKHKPQNMSQIIIQKQADKKTKQKMQNKINNKNTSYQYQYQQQQQQHHHHNNNKKIYPSRQQLALLLQQENSLREEMMKNIEEKKKVIQMLRGRVMGEHGEHGEDVSGVSMLLAEYMVNEMELWKSKVQIQNRILVTRQQIRKQEQQLRVLGQQRKVNATPCLSQYQQKSLRIMRIKQSMQKIEEQLEQQYQLSQYQNQRLHQQLITQSKQLEKLKEIKRQLDCQIQVLELRNIVQRNTVVIQIGKVEELQKQGKQLQQNLKALQKHKQQITQRIQIMKQQQQQYKAKQPKQPEQQQQQQHRQGKAQKNKRKHGNGHGSRQQNQYKQKQKQKWTIKQLTEIERQINNLKIEEDKLDLQISQYCKYRIDYEDAVRAVQDGRKNRKKRIAKMDKRLRGLDADIQGLEQELLVNRQANKLAANQIQQLQQYFCTLQQQTTEMQKQLTILQSKPTIAHSQKVDQPVQRQRQISASAGQCTSALASTLTRVVIKQEENVSKQGQKLKSILWKPQIIILLFFIIGVGVVLLI